MEGIMTSTELFGGAMAVNLPTDAVDISNFRQVPDNQEVFSNPKTDQSVIIEIVEHVDEPDEQAIRTHYADLACCNEAGTDEDTQILQSEVIPKENLAMKQAAQAYFVTGKQQVAKFNEETKNEVSIHMAVFRLPQFETDILVTFNDPSISHLPNQGNMSSQPWTLEHFKQAVLSLKILQEDIFG